MEETTHASEGMCWRLQDIQTSVLTNSETFLKIAIVGVKVLTLGKRETF